MQSWIKAVLERLKERAGKPDRTEGDLQMLSCDFECSIHLAVFVEPYLQLVLDGRKTIESRFSVNRCPPYRVVKKGDLLLLKRSGGPVVGVAVVAQVWSYDLDPRSWSFIKDRFGEQLCITDPTFWDSKQDASYATLMRLERAMQINPIAISKRDRRGWVVLQGHPQQRSLPILA